ncbi:hypothetical protein [Brevundimonas sp. TWP2-3-4b1]|uniref:hypothetical protein n=1 Tax=Brevundimonas sp. TWP2-3-4b1 TaxID=2804580 RepID=UPI003CE9C3F0
MSVREKAAWISLGSGAVIWGFYFVVVWSRLVELPGEWPVALFVECVIASLLVQGVLMGLAAIRTPRDQRTLSDEREIQIDGRATSVGYAALTGLVLCVALISPFAVGMEFGGLAIASRAEAATIMGLLAIVLAEVVKSAVVVILHRRIAA